MHIEKRWDDAKSILPIEQRVYGHKHPWVPRFYLLCGHSLHKMAVYLLTVLFPHVCCINDLDDVWAIKGGLEIFYSVTFVSTFGFTLNRTNIKNRSILNNNQKEGTYLVWNRSDLYTTTAGDTHSISVPIPSRYLSVGKETTSTSICWVGCLLAISWNSRPWYSPSG